MSGWVTGSHWPGREEALDELMHKTRLKFHNLLGVCDVLVLAGEKRPGPFGERGCTHPLRDLGFPSGEAEGSEVQGPPEHPLGR